MTLPKAHNPRGHEDVFAAFNHGAFDGGGAKYVEAPQDVHGADELDTHRQVEAQAYAQACTHTTTELRAQANAQIAPKAVRCRARHQKSPRGLRSPGAHNRWIAAERRR